MAEKERCVKVFTQGGFQFMEIWVDTETGVNYLYRQAGNSGGFTVLLDKDGKPIVSDM